MQEPSTQQQHAEVSGMLIHGACWALHCIRQGLLSEGAGCRDASVPCRLCSLCYGLIIAVMQAQVGVLLRGSVPHPLPGCMPLIVTVCLHRTQDAVKRLPTNWAHSIDGSPLPDTAKTEAVKAGGHVGSIADGIQADGTSAV